MNIIKLYGYDAVYGAYSELRDVFPNLHKRVNINDYIHKLAAFAEVFAVKNKDGVCGFAAAYMNDTNEWNGKTAYLTLIGVSKKTRKQGIGSALLMHCIGEAKSKGMARFKLEVDKDNSTAIALYKKNGLTIVSDASDSSYYMEMKL